MSDYDKLVDTWLRNKEVEHTKKYVEQGRRFKGLPLTDLISLWVAAFDRFASKFNDGPDRLDLESELILRGEKIPHELVEVQHKALIRKAREVGEMITRNPELLERWEDAVEEIDELQRQLSRPKH